MNNYFIPTICKIKPTTSATKRISSNSMFKLEKKNLSRVGFKKKDQVENASHASVSEEIYQPHSTCTTLWDAMNSNDKSHDGGESGPHYNRVTELRTLFFGKLALGARRPTAATHFQQTEGCGVGSEPGGPIREAN